MSKITKYALLFVVLACSLVRAQDRVTDSVLKAAQNPKLHDTTRLFIIATGISAFNQGDRGLYGLNNHMGKLAMDKFKTTTDPVLKKKYATYVGAFYNNRGNEYGYKRDVVNTVSAYDKSYAFFKFAGANAEMNFTLITKAVFLSKINDNEKAIDCLFTALKFYEKNPKQNEDEIMYILSTLATIYEKQGRHSASIAANKKVIGYYAQRPGLVNDDILREGMAHVNCGSSYLEVDNYREAMAHLEQALVLFRKIKHPLYPSITLSKMARVKMKEAKFDEAEALLNQALSGDVPELGVANVDVKMGELFYLKKDLGKADHYLTKGLSESKEIRNLELQEQASDLLFKVSTARRDFEKALEMHVFHNQLLDSSKTETSKNTLAQQQLKYDFEKKELKYRFANQQRAAVTNNWLTALSGILVLLLLGGYFYYRNSKQKQAITVLEKDQIKQRLLISQMNPHFIFNSIQNIRGLIHERQNDDAVNYLDKFSRLTRQILENSNETYISLTEEIEMTQNYLAIQQLLHHNKFDYSVAVDETIDTDSLFLPPMLTQPFIENAIKHGLGNTESGGKVDIHFYLKETKLFFEVTDNGKGFDGSKNSNNHKSMAMAITKERLVHYARNQDFVVQTDNLLDQNQKITGAKVAFEIPYIYEN